MIQTLILCLIVSLAFNLILILQRPNQKKLSKNIDTLNQLLSSSTSNVDKLISENVGLRQLIEQLNKSKTSLLMINKGDRVLSKQNMVHKPTDTHFDVLYEVVVTDISATQLKVNATSFQSTHEWPNETKNKQAVIGYLQNKWVDRSECELILNTQHIRDAKLDDLLA